jgi:hypothetical protein
VQDGFASLVHGGPFQASSNHSGQPPLRAEFPVARAKLQRSVCSGKRAEKYRFIRKLEVLYKQRILPVVKAI